MMELKNEQSPSFSWHWSISVFTVTIDKPHTSHTTILIESEAALSHHLQCGSTPEPCRCGFNPTLDQRETALLAPKINGGVCIFS
jgi:hypothetical protein